jgi:hypothetical protein
MSMEVQVPANKVQSSETTAYFQLPGAYWSSMLLEAAQISCKVTNVTHPQVSKLKNGVKCVLVRPNRVEMVWAADEFNTVVTNYIITIGGLTNPLKPTPGK